MIQPKRVKFNVFSASRMRCWREANGLPSYINDSYRGYTGLKECQFPTQIRKHGSYPDITDRTREFEEEILQELKDTRKKPFGYFRALIKMCQNFSTGDPWDPKYMPQFPGKTKKGQLQFAQYKGEVVSACDMSNIIYGHVCAYMKIPKCIAKLLARLDACGALEIFTKGRFPDAKLRRFKDSPQDQLAIEKGMKGFNISDYRLK